MICRDTALYLMQQAQRRIRTYPVLKPVGQSPEIQSKDRAPRYNPQIKPRDTVHSQSPVLLFVIHLFYMSVIGNPYIYLYTLTRDFSVSFTAIIIYSYYMNTFPRLIVITQPKYVTAGSESLPVTNYDRTYVVSTILDSPIL